MADAYPQKIFRFVNDWDIVPRVPPGYSHVGRLFYFDAQGNLLVGANETMIFGDSAVPNMLNEMEFKELQREISQPAVSEEGLTTIISDHAMALYIAKIDRIAKSNP